jgi:hypothetical protein
LALLTVTVALDRSLLRQPGREGDQMNSRAITAARLTVVIGAVLAATLGMSRRADAQEPVARFHGVIVNMGATVPGTAATPVNFVINRWSTAEEQEQVMGTVLEGGGKALLNVLQKLPAVASVAPVAGVGFNVQYAAHSRGEDGVENIVLLTDRPMSFAERWYGGRSTDYPYMLISLRVLPAGTGDGQIIVAGRLTADKFNRTLVVENLDIQPLRVENLKRER